MTLAEANDVLTAAREILELKVEVRRMRDLKDEAIEQAEQWKRAFVAEQTYAKELERQLHGGHAA